ncbi:MAG: glycosyltransferase family 4 protein [Candidatus Aenigmarchaeota archaeon]|nr:glycosyltransferase family 4 protein [Candidatus Aenigmarchaeota archaeon]
MKIGIVIRHCRNVKASRYVIETSRYFCDEGHEVHVFTSRWDDLDDKVIIHKIPKISNIFFIQEILFLLMASILLKFYKFDVTLAQATRYFSPSVCEMQFVYKTWSEGRKSDKKIGKNIGLKLRELRLRGQDIFSPPMEGFNLRNCKQVIAISNLAKKEIMNFYNIPSKKINVVHSGANLDFFNPNKRKFRNQIFKKHGIDLKDTLILFVGNPFDRKGLEFVIKSLPKVNHKKIKLLVIGRKEVSDMSYYNNLSKKLKVENKIKFIGLTPELNKYLASSDIFIFPTLYEPFGLVILEAMASGISVITSKYAGATELIDNMKDGIILEDPKDYNKIADKINYLLNDKKRMKTMGKRARKKAEKYSWNAAAEKMLKVFKKSLS